MRRREFLSLAPLAAAAAQTSPEGTLTLRPRSSLAIASSRISVGFETLDRKMFDPERCYPYLAQSGAKWARCQTGWARTERTKGVYDFAWLDSVVDRLLAIGIQPWFNLGFGNTLYMSGPPHETAVGWPPLTPEARKAWVLYTRAVAEHFAGRVKHWEIWNEPNSSFWYPGPHSPEAYVDLVKITVPEIRKRVPGAVIVGGALGAFMSMVRVMDYLERCLQLGLADYIDKLSYHPYAVLPESNADSMVRAMRSLLARYKPGIALWQGENGAPSEKGAAGNMVQLDWNEERQARWLLRRLVTDLRLDVELTSYFHTVDLRNYITARGPAAGHNPKGLLRGADYTPKLSFRAFQCLCSLFDGETRPADLLLFFKSVREDGLQWGTFIRRGSPIYAYWKPADLLSDYTQARTGLLLWSGAAARMADPVLIDPLRAQVRKLEGAEMKNGCWVVEAAPVQDYPLLIADRAAIADLIG